MTRWTDISMGTQGQLDPDVAYVLAKAAEMNLPPLWTMSPVEARAEFARRLSRSNPPPPEGVAALDMTIGGGIPVRVYKAEGQAPKGVLLYFHGGGFVVGDLDCYDSVCRNIAARTGSVVASVDYRLGPEHPYPAAIQDGAAALAWAASGPTELGGPGLPLGIAGDSAGGTLSAVTALAARDKGIALAAQILIYPAVDQGGDYPSRARLAEGHLLTQADIDWFTAQYFKGSAIPVLAETASPLRAASHAGLAPATIIVCGFDPLVDEGVAYGAALRAANVPTRLVRLEGAIHGCMGLAAYLDCGRKVLDEACQSWSAAIGG